MTRVVVISGGGTGIGRATAELFSAAGDQVVLLGRRESVLAQAAAQLRGRDTGSAISATRTGHVALPTISGVSSNGLTS